MATAVAFDIPGLHREPTETDYEISRCTYNCLPDDKNQPHPSDVLLREVGKIIFDYHLHNIFGLHLMHGHLQVPTGCTMLGTNLDGMFGWWTRPVPVNDLHVGSMPVHGHLFTCSAYGRLSPYEFRQGPRAPNLLQIPDAFFQEFVDCLQHHRAETLLALQVLDTSHMAEMQEFVVGEVGTVMISQVDIKSAKRHVTTGWTFTASVGGAISFKGVEYHGAPSGVGPHILFTDGKFGYTQRELLDLLVDVDVLTSADL